MILVKTECYYQTYSDFLPETKHGKKLLDLDSKILKVLDEYMEGRTITITSADHPDELWLNRYFPYSHRDIVYELYRNSEEFEAIDDFDEFVEQHFDEIEDALKNNRNVVYLGYANEDFHVLE